LKILLSIKPEYVNKILSGEKIYEYRRVMPKNKVDSILIYSSWPCCKIIGEVEVKEIITYSVSDMWKKTKHNSGISYYKYRDYFKGKNRASAFVLGNITLYDKKLDLNECGFKKPPQSFIYVK